jgi:hypothetical protein
MSDSALKLSRQFLVHLMAFEDSGEGDAYADELIIAEVTDVADGFTEIAITHDERHIYIRFRDSHLNHARKDSE